MTNPKHISPLTETPSVFQIHIDFVIFKWTCSLTLPDKNAAIKFIPSQNKGKQCMKGSDT